jgi:hypothetical protein
MGGVLQSQGLRFRDRDWLDWAHGSWGRFRCAITSSASKRHTRPILAHGISLATAIRRTVSVETPSMAAICRKSTSGAGADLSTSPAAMAVSFVPVPHGDGSSLPSSSRTMQDRQHPHGARPRQTKPTAR